MIAVFMDTNIYKALGYNFDSRNEIIKSFKNLIDNKEIKNIMISVINSEIEDHLNKKKEENRNAIKKYCKWINDIIDEQIIEDNLNKELKDFKKFKEDTLTEIISTNNVEPEKVLEKYFKVEPPFENKKQYEFKDAFFVESVLEYIKNNTYSKYIVVSKDNGVRKAIESVRNGRIIILESIPQLIDVVINYGNKRKSELISYIKGFDLKTLIQKEYKINYEGIEEENIEIEDILVSNVLGIEILKDLANSVIVACDVGVVLKGKFSCLDYDNSYYSFEESEYLYKQYLEKEEMMFICTTVIEVIKSDEGYSSIIIRDFPDINIDYEEMKI